MREQRIDYFQYSEDQNEQILYLKSRYMASDQLGYEQQKSFDEALIALNLFDFSEYGPSAIQFNSILNEAGYNLRDFRLETI